MVSDTIQEFRTAIGSNWNHKREVDQVGLKNFLRFNYLISEKGINFVRAVLRQTLDKEEFILERNEATARTGRNSGFAKVRGHMLRTRRRDMYLRTLAAGSTRTTEYVKDVWMCDSELKAEYGDNWKMRFGILEYLNNGGRLPPIESITKGEYKAAKTAFEDGDGDYTDMISYNS
jgi:hypothetical protein